MVLLKKQNGEKAEPEALQISAAESFFRLHLKAEQQLAL
jgi:hypothetical protein